VKQALKARISTAGRCWQHRATSDLCTS
jgi:hypothetical protein